jgi:hypothetical protein
MGAGPILFPAPSCFKNDRKDVDPVNIFFPRPGPVIGRIFHTPQAPEGKPWFWTALCTPQQANEYGYCATREEAMAAFRLAWGNWRDIEG